MRSVACHNSCLVFDDIRLALENFPLDVLSKLQIQLQKTVKPVFWIFFYLIFFKVFDESSLISLPKKHFFKKKPVS